jgi:hypothetical protein
LRVAGYRKVEDKFDYLMRLPVSTFTAESIEKQPAEAGRAPLRRSQRLESLQRCGLWLTELSGV